MCIIGIKLTQKDTILYYNGIRLNRIFTEWTEKKGYSLIIGNSKTATAIVEWNLEPINPIKTKLTIDINVFTDVALQRYNLVLRTIIKYSYFLPYMRHYIQTVCKGFKYYIETNDLVKKINLDTIHYFQLKLIDKLKWVQLDTSYI